MSASSEWLACGALLLDLLPYIPFEFSIVVRSIVVGSLFFSASASAAYVHPCRCVLLLALLSCLYGSSYVRSEELGF